MTNKINEKFPRLTYRTTNRQPDLSLRVRKYATENHMSMNNAMEILLVKGLEG